jgi:hypothetical protein
MKEEPMSKKILRKRLFLNKETIAHLSLLEMKTAKGGCTTVTLEETCEDTCNPILYNPAKGSLNTCYTEPGHTD